MLSKQTKETEEVEKMHATLAHERKLIKKNCLISTNMKKIRSIKRKVYCKFEYHFDCIVLSPSHKLMVFLMTCEFFHYFR